MLTIPHTLAGAAIGTLVQDFPAAPLIAFGLGWASHYVLDSVPHWERVYKAHEEIDFATDQPAKDWPRHIFIQAAIDVIFAAIIIAWLFMQAGPPNSALVWGAIGGAFPDLLGNVPFWNKFLVKLPLFKQEKKFHETIHISREAQIKSFKYTGLVTQLAVAVFSIFIILAS